ncbi:hypothetical protein [Microbacterium lacticum]
MSTIAANGFVAALAPTLFRVVPVYVAMLGSSVSWRDRTALGFIGPRDTATIVFGLLVAPQVVRRWMPRGTQPAASTDLA